LTDVAVVASGNYGRMIADVRGEMVRRADSRCHGGSSHWGSHIY
jgi:hypothetical protein